MSKQDDLQASVPKHPSNDERHDWRKHWRTLNQPWRTEPEITSERQDYLTHCLTNKPNIERGIYPLKDIEPKLIRADIEWLLATHENGRGPIDWSDESQRRREGLDLHDADLNRIDLSNLPFARIRGGLTWDEWNEATEQQRNMAAVWMQDAKLRGAHLEGARLRRAHLERADLKYTYLERTQLRYAHIERTHLGGAYLNGTDIYNATLSDEKQIGPGLSDIHWGDINLSVVKWSTVELLRDEYDAIQKESEGEMKNGIVQLTNYEVAVRANRQLAVALQAQGLNEDAARFSYRAQRLQRVVLRRQRKFGASLSRGLCK